MKEFFGTGVLWQPVLRNKKRRFVFRHRAILRFSVLVIGNRKNPVFTILLYMVLCASSRSLAKISVQKCLNCMCLYWFLAGLGIIILNNYFRVLFFRAVSRKILTNVHRNGYCQWCKFNNRESQSTNKTKMVKLCGILANLLRIAWF